MKRILMIALLTIGLTFSACKTDKGQTKDTKIENTENKEDTDNKEDKDKKEDAQEVKNLELTEEIKPKMKETTEKVTNLLSERKLDDFKAILSEEFKKATEGQDLDIFSKFEDQLGKFEKFENIDYKTQQGYYITDSVLRFEHGTIDQIVALSEKMEVEGVNYSNLMVDIVADNFEEPITVDAGTGFPLKGMLALPEGEVKAAVVIVDGSGPNNMNLTIGQNNPMKHMSDQLVEKGIAVVRFNKRTYEYAKKFAMEGIQNEVLIKDEFIDDAAAALKFVQTDKRLKDADIYLMGHSQSATYLPEINKKSGDIAKGYLVLAGTPKNLMEITKMQIDELISQIEKTETKTDEEKKNLDMQIKYTKQSIEANEEILKKLDKMSDEELKKPENAPYGMPGIYAKDLLKYDGFKLYKDNKLPVFVRIGEFDRQVPSTEIKTWEDLIGDRENVDIKELKGVNHLMQESDGKTPIDKLYATEYQEDKPINSALINDIAAFVEANK